MFIVVLTYQAPIEEVDAHLKAHIEFLDQYYEEGVFLASGRRVPRVGGVILAEAESEEALRAIVDADPFLTSGVATAEIIEFAPTRAIPALSALVGV